VSSKEEEDKKNAENSLRGYNDMLYLIEKYARLEGLGKYNPDMEG